jgi:hypothetical protein
MERARNILLQFPKLGRRHIAEVELKGEHGVVHQTDGTPAGHHEWWPTKGLAPCGFYRRGIQ